MWYDENPAKIYPRMRDALNETGRKILFSMCEWGLWFPWEWASDIASKLFQNEAEKSRYVENQYGHI
jgi:hypothetical protein